MHRENDSCPLLLHTYTVCTHSLLATNGIRGNKKKMEGQWSNGKGSRLSKVQ